MPREREDFIRESNVSDAEQLFILAYEGNKTEPDYFEALKSSSDFKQGIIELVSLRRDKNNTNSAPKHVFNKLKRDVKDEFNLNSSDELWMIIDRDRNRNNIPTYFELCQNEGNFYLALSNPCFELWLLLHIEDVNSFSAKKKEDIFENTKVNRSRTYIEKYLSDLLPDGYNKSNPSPNRFLTHIRLAIQRAKLLDVNNEDYPTHLGSHVYKLAEKILR
jgi:RloB-like protein